MKQFLEGFLVQVLVLFYRNRTPFFLQLLGFFASLFQDLFPFRLNVVNLDLPLGLEFLKFLIAFSLIFTVPIDQFVQFNYFSLMRCF